MNVREIQQVKRRLREKDLKSEVIIAQMIKEKIIVSLEDIQVKPISSFKKSYEQDISEIKQISLGKQVNLVEFSVNRDGLYDLLPEGVFHQPPKVKDEENEHLGVLKINKRKEEEVAARKFFLPIDAEYAHQRIQIELDEVDAITGFSYSIQHHLLETMWGEDVKDLSTGQKSILFRLIPLSSLILGNMVLMQKAIELVIGYPVRIEKTYNNNFIKYHNDQLGLGEITMGINSILGEGYYDIKPSFDIEIGPILETSIISFLPGKQSSKIVNMMCGFFIPCEFEFQINILVSKTKFHLKLNEECKSRLGYSTVLG